MAETLQDGRYVVVGLLGEGAQGQTLDAVDKRLGRPVAIKRFDVRGARVWKDVELAERETRVLQSLAHPMLPRYLDHFEEGGALYLVMERIDGESLAAVRKKGGTFTSDEALRFLREAAVVLDYLHGRAPPVVHRDLKPGNVVRRGDGSYAFVDFGAVRDRLRPEGGSTVVGTFGYMAPEQFQGRAQPSSDVYAIGATALAMLTGEEPERLPHKGLALDVRAALAAAGQRAAGPLTSILEKMLDPDPDRRPTRIAPLLEHAVPRDAGGARGEGRSARRAERYDRRAEDYARRADAGGPAADAWRQGADAWRQGADRWRAGADAWHQAMRNEDWLAGPREARRAALRARRAARRAVHRSRHASDGEAPPAWLMVTFFAASIVAVSFATQWFTPALLVALSRLLRMPRLVQAADDVRRAGVAGIANLKESQAWFAARAREAKTGGPTEPARVVVETPLEGDGPRVRVQASAGQAEEGEPGDDGDAFERIAKR